MSVLMLRSGVSRQPRGGQEELLLVGRPRSGGTATGQGRTSHDDETAPRGSGSLSTAK